MKILLLAVLLMGVSTSSFCQKEDTLISAVLPTVIVNAFEQNKKTIDVAAAVNVINGAALSRYDNSSLLTAINATAGAKMEERSPGSYRLNIRGSSLRSPFGVRNVKIYYNNIPLTDAGGNTYLNQLGFENVGNIEILKGPGSSLYGAGIGGVVLLKAPKRKPGIGLSQSFGSYGMQQSRVSVSAGNDTLHSDISFQYQKADGYRQQSAMKRSIASWIVSAKPTAKSNLIATFFYGDLFYQTPGALTLSEYEKDASTARPKVGTSSSAADAKAAIYQKTFFGGISYENRFCTAWTMTASLYGATTQMNNPAIRNYARNNQPGFGGRTFFTYKKKIDLWEITWITGAEAQQGFTSAKVYKNNNGIPDSLQTDDEINIHSWFAFTQLNLIYNKWIATVGGSFNRSGYDFTRLSNSPALHYNVLFSKQISPRVSLLRKLSNRLSAYAVWSKGFSPPTTDELFPTGSFSNPNLSPEKGNSYELGVKGYALSQRFTLDVSAFYFRLTNTIVQRRDAAGGDYYTNAGSTKQKGLETQLNYSFFKPTFSGKSASVWVSHAWYNFRYNSFKQLTNDYSGNEMPGVAKHFLTAGADALWKGFYGHLTFQYSSSVQLNDGNTAAADPYHLLSLKVGYKRTFTKITTELFTGGDNLLNMHYSLGNDINGFGGRYYNAAPLRSFYVGVFLLSRN